MKTQPTRKKHRAAAIKECAEQVPTSWLDNLLSGKDSVLKGDRITWECPDIEALCNGIRARILSLGNDK